MAKRKDPQFKRFMQQVQKPVSLEEEYSPEMARDWWRGLNEGQQAVVYAWFVYRQKEVERMSQC